MDHNKQKLSGVFAPVVTPFQGDQPDLDALDLQSDEAPPDRSDRLSRPGLQLI